MYLNSKDSVRRIAIIFSVILALQFSGCTSKDINPNNLSSIITKNTIKHQIIKVQLSEIDAEINGCGFIIPSKLKTLNYNNISGTLNKVLVKENDYIKVGQPVAEIDPYDLSEEISDKENQMKRWPIKMEQLQQQIINSKSSMELAQLSIYEARKIQSPNNKFMKQLQLQYEIALSNYNNTKLNQSISLMDYDNDKKELKTLTTKLQEKILKSTVEGNVVSISNISQNQMVNAGDTIMKVVEKNNIIFKFIVPEAENITNIKNAKLMINKKIYDVSIFSPQPGDQIENDSSNDQYSLDKAVYLKFNGAAPNLNIEDVVAANLKLKKVNVHVLPKEAVYQEAGRNYINVMDGDQEKAIQVTTGLESDENVEITSNVVSGEDVILR